MNHEWRKLLYGEEVKHSWSGVVEVCHRCGCFRGDPDYDGGRNGYRPIMRQISGQRDLGGATEDCALEIARSVIDS
jgi:hypothetical protein